MKNKKSIIVALVLLILVSALYRVFPNRPWGFAPQIAMTLFGGAIFIKDKKWAFALPIISMFIGDLFFEFLYKKGLSVMPGFYDGQILNYSLFAALTVVGFFIRKINVVNVFTATLVSPTLYFLISNFIVWAGNSGTRGFGRPKTFAGLMQCYTDGLPFYPGSLAATVFFSLVLFGGYYLITDKKRQPVIA